MTELYTVKNYNLYDKVKELSLRHITAPIEILRTETGKPYFAGNPLYFSVSHSGDRAAIAFCDKPVGVDLEILKPRNYLTVLSRFSQREKNEINGLTDFLIHWTAREAYVKMKGLTLWSSLMNLEFFGGDIYYCGEKQDALTSIHKLDFGIAAVCTQN